MEWIFVIFGMIVGACLEALVIKVPFVLVVLLLVLIFIQKPWTIVLSIPAGVLVDSLLFRTLGLTSLFFAVMMGLFFGYGKKFEIQSMGFMIFSSLVTSVLYFALFGAENIVVQVLITVVVAIVLFAIVSLIQERIIPSKRLHLDH